MISSGVYKLSDGTEYGVVVIHSKLSTEVIAFQNNEIVSAYKKNIEFEGAFNNKIGDNIAKILKIGISGCSSKNGIPAPFALGACSKHVFKKSNINFEISRYNNELCGAYVTSDRYMLDLRYCDQNWKVPDINYVEYTKKESDLAVKDGNESDDIPVRSLEEIGLSKDLSWLKNKNYYIVNDEATAEQLFQFLDNYNGTISFDTETTGLKINMFCQVGSDKKKELDELNRQAKNKDEIIRTDRLVGFIYSVQENVGYYFPVGNRKFKNLYNDVNEPVTRKTINNILASYTVGEYRDRHDCMAEYIRNTPPEQWGSDVILMERNRKILETKYLLAHNGVFEWKVCWCYCIDFNLKEDTIIMHQLMYKFRTTTSNRGEPSNLKYLSKVELGVDQLELSDFFSGFSEDDSGKTKSSGKKKGARIDFSYMDYDGSRAYAPADGDLTLCLFHKYKKDMIENHPELEYLYHVEILVSCAIGYMEFYGHRIDPEKIDNIRKDYISDKIETEHAFRVAINYNTQDEDAVFEEINKIKADIAYLTNHIDELKKNNLDENKSLIEQLKNDRKAQYAKKEELQEKAKGIMENSVNSINLGSPSQLAELFYGTLQIPCPSDKWTISKKIIGQVAKMKNSDGTLKYPCVSIYQKWKNIDTYLTKFFDNLPDFMYPGGFIFSHFGQISTATGRMSCIEENTPIQMENGTKAIKDIRVGDRVLCKDKYMATRVKKVTNVLDRGYKKCIRINWRSLKTFKSGSLICTPDHRILTTNRGYVEAQNLKTYDRISHNMSDTVRNEPIAYESMEYVGVKHVYDIEVKHIHNFIADGIVVHNCNKPNAQQYPKAVTAIVKPRPGFVMVDADFSQIEYRTLVALADEEDLKKKFEDPDMDYHTTMASLMYGVPYASVTAKQRGDAKSFNFGIPYGMGFGSLAILLTGVNTEATRAEAMEKYELYFKDQPKVRQFFRDIKEFANVKGYTETYWGRRRYYSFVDKDGNFSNAKKAQALRQAGNAIIQGSAADIFKIAVARNFAFIRNNKLFGKMLIVNMIHDEQLLEVDATKLDVQSIVSALVQNMELKIDGFPPLYVGAGVGLSWKDAKGKMNEINPKLAHQLVEESKGKPIFVDKPKTQQEVLDYFNKRVYEFRRDKIIDYVKDNNNYHKTLHPVIGNLLSLQFDYGVNAEFDAKYTEDNGYTKDEIANAKKLIPIEQLKRFLADMGITDIDAELFMSEEDLKNEQAVYEDDSDEDEEYSDGEDEDTDDIETENFGGEKFEIINESNSLYGIDLRDVISEFGIVVSKQLRVCGIDANKVKVINKDKMNEYINKHISNDPEADVNPDCFELVFLMSNNIIKRTGGYLQDIKTKDLAKACGLDANLYG